MSDDDYHVHRMIELQELRDARRLKRRHTKMVVDGAGIKKLRTQHRATLGAEPVVSRSKR